MTANEPDFEARVRARLRHLRFERGLTLAQVAAGAGMATSTVSRLESGARGLTLAHLAQLAAGLRVEVEEIVGGPAPADPVPARDGKVWWPLVDERAGSRRAYRIRLPGGGGEPVLGTHEGHVWLVVLAGRLRLVVGARDVVLEPGDAAGFTTWTPHWIGAVDEPVEVFAVFAPDGRGVRFRDVA